jgi:WhiB family redox-sensing transcriptional regulator
VALAEHHYAEPPWAPPAANLQELLGCPDWMRDALCLEYPELEFHPDRDESLEPLKAVCRRCKVREECLDYALADDNLLGVWGGTSMRERERYREAWPWKRRGPRP